MPLFRRNVSSITGTANQINISPTAPATGDVTLSLAGGNFTGFANPTASLGLTAVNGSATTAMRSDGAPALSQSIVPTWTGEHTWSGVKKFQSGSKTLTAVLESMHYFSTTITNNTGTFVNGLHLGNTFNGDADSPVQLLVRPFFAPSSAITDAFGGSLAGVHNGGTITTLTGFRPIVGSFSNTGAVTSFVGVRCDGPVYTGTVRATNAYGIYIQNQGVASQTNAIGIHIAAQSGSTNNYDMSFGRVDTTAAGAYYGRVPVLYNGLLKYIHIFSA